MGKYLCFPDSRCPDGHPGNRVLLLDLETVPNPSADRKKVHSRILSPSPFLPFSLLCTIALQKLKTARLEWKPELLQLMLVWVLQMDQFSHQFASCRRLGSTKESISSKWLGLNNGELLGISLMLQQGMLDNAGGPSLFEQHNERPNRPGELEEPTSQ